LETPFVTVSMEDGRELSVRVLNPDYLRWDRTAAKHGWPSMAKAPHTWLTFVAWSALKREGQIGPEVTWEDFSERLCLQVVNARPDTNGRLPSDEALAAVGAIAPDLMDYMEAADGVDPTPQGPGPA